MYPGREEMKRLNVTVAAGTGTGTLSKEWSLARRIRVVPPSESATFDISLKDADGHLIFKRTNQVGTLSELQEISLGIAASVLIENATVSGTYAVKFDMH